MKTSLANIASLLGCASTPGANTVDITGIASIGEAKEGDITFLAHKKYLNAIAASRASAFILPHGITVDKPHVLYVKNPYIAFAKLLDLFYPEYISSYSGKIDQDSLLGKGIKLGANVSIYPNVFIGDNVSIGDNTIIYPGVFIGNNCKIGKDTRIYANVSIYDCITIGNNVIIHSGTVIGSDGFGFVRDDDGRYYKIPQKGGVIIEDDVELGSNVCIDRATMGSTIIKRGTKLDNMVQVAHNVTIGEDSVIAAQSGVSGSSRLGKNLMIGGQVGIADHITIADNTILIAQTGVAGDIDTGGAYSGSPAIPHNTWKRVQVSLPMLPDLLKRIKRLENEIKELKEGKE